MKARLPQGYGGGPGNMNQMLKQAQKMQEDAQNLQADLDEREYTATSGGMVEVTIDGTHHIKSINIKPEAVDPDDVEMLQDMIVAAMNSAVDEAINTAEEEMSKITGGLNLPGMGGLF
jgi:DNA-binding YbaB/EbfC family protein